MTRIVDRHYLIDLLNQCYTEQQVNCYFCMEGNCRFCRRSLLVEDELRIKKFDLERRSVLPWIISYSRKDPDNFVIQPVDLLWFFWYRELIDQLPIYWYGRVNCLGKKL